MPMPLAELMLVLFAILVIATPFITLVLLGKYKRLRENLDQFAEENSRQHASLQREVADLRRQFTAAVAAAPAVKETPVPATRVDLPGPVKLPAPVSLPLPEKKPETQPVRKPQEPAPIVPTPVSIAPASTPVQRPPAPPAPVEP